MQMGFRRTGCKIIQTKKFNFEIKHLTLTNRMELSLQDFQSSKEITIHFLMKSIQCPTEGSLMSKSNLIMGLFMYFALTWSLLLMEYLQVIFLSIKFFFEIFIFFFAQKPSRKSIELKFQLLSPMSTPKQRRINQSSSFQTPTMVKKKLLKISFKFHNSKF